jgi:hypothetical protein
MKTHPGNLLHRPRILTLLLAVTLVGAVLGLSQCKMIDDPVTSVDVRDNSTFHRSKRSACEHECERDYKRCKKIEHRRHEQAERDCKEFKKGSDEREACREAEEELHDRNVDACKAAKKQCKRDCRYHEGSGDGGR